MAITLVGAVENDASTTLTTIASDVPVGTTDGDYLLWRMSSNNANNIPATPTGWTLLQDWSLTANSGAVYGRLVESGDPSSYSTTAGSSRWCSEMISLRGVDPTTQLDVAVPNESTSTSGLAAPPAITPVTDGAYIVMTFGAQVASGLTERVTSSSNMTKHARSLNAGASGSIAQGAIFGTELVTAAEFTPNLTVDSDPSRSAVVTLALRPETGGSNGEGTATGTFDFTGSAVGTTTRTGAASGTWDFAGTATGDAPALPGDNMLPNPSFEDESLTSWGTGNSGTLTREAVEDAPHGSYVARVVATGAGTVNLLNFANVPAAAAEQWSAGSQVRQTVGTFRNVRVDILFDDSLGAVITPAVLGSQTTLTSSFQEIENLGATAHAGTARVRIRVSVLSAAIGDTFEYDLTQLRQGSTLPSEFPTGTASGDFAFSGSATGAAPTLEMSEGTATGSWAFAGTATGEAPTVPVNEGTSTGSWSFAGSATGESDRFGTATGTFTWAGSAAGTTDKTGTAAGAWDFAGAAVGDAPTMPGDNALSNPSFEDASMTTWGTGNSGTLTREAVPDAPHGSYVARVVATGAGTVNLLDFDNVLASAAELWSAGIRVRQTVGTLRNMRVDVQFYDSTDTLIAPAVLGSQTTASSSWQQLKNEGVVAHTGTARARIRVSALSAAVGDTFEYDLAQLVEAATLTPEGSATGSWAFEGAAVGVAPEVPVKEGSASGSWAFSGSATGEREPKGTAVGTFTWSGSASGEAPPNEGTASSSWTFTGSAAGTTDKRGTSAGGWSFSGAAQGRTTKRGTAAGTFSFTGSATGKRTPKGSASGSWSFTGAAAGKTTKRGVAAPGTFTFSGSATGKRTPKGTALGVFTFGGSASGDVPPNGGLATGVFSFTGSAAGSAPVLEIPTGSASGSWAFDGAADGRTTKRGSGAGTFVFTGSAQGRTDKEGTATGAYAFDGDAAGRTTMRGSAGGTFQFTGTATGKRTPKGTAGGTWTFSGSAVGDAPVVPMSEGTASGTWLFTGVNSGTTEKTGTATGTFGWIGQAVAGTQRFGTAAGSWSYTGTAAGKRVAKGSTLGVFTFGGSASGDVPPNRGLSAGIFAFTGSASGQAPSVEMNEGSSTGSWAFSGGAQGRTDKRGTASDSWTFVGASQGRTDKRGAASGTFSYDGSASGTAPEVEMATGAAGGTTSWAGSAVGKRAPRGSGSGTTTWSGAATGDAPTLLPNTGSASGETVWTGTGLGYRLPKGQAAGQVEWKAAVLGSTPVYGTATGLWSFSGAATGRSFPEILDLPPERTTVVPAESRVVVVSASSMPVPQPEARLVIVPAENRTVVVP